MRKYLLSPSASVIVSLALALGILVADSANLRSLTTARAQSGRAFTPLADATLVGARIAARNVLVNGERVSGVFAGSVRVVDSVLIGDQASASGVHVNDLNASGVHVNDESADAGGVHVNDESANAGGVHVNDDKATTSGVHVNDDKVTTSGVHVNDGQATTSGVHVNDGQATVTGGVVRGIGVRVVNGVITGEDLQVVGAVVREAAAGVVVRGN